jgi:ketosteroid isomerase-like protein
MTTESAKTTAEAQIRALIDDWVKALRAKDVDGVMSHYAADIVTFDLAPPLEYRGWMRSGRASRRVVPNFPRSGRLRDSRPEHHDG